MINLRYAEILYSQGGPDNVDNFYLARKYFSHALSLQDNKSSMISRALFGLL